MEITSNMIIKADGTTKQNIKKGTGIKTPHIQDGAVTTAKIGNEAVIESKIANGAVTGSKLGDNSITSSKIKDGSVGNAEIANGAVTSAKLANDSVTYEKLDSNTRGKLVTNGDSHTHSAADVGALPITGGTLNGNFSVNGKIGIGTSEPGAVLDVNGDLLTTDIKINGTNQGSNYIRFGDVQLAWGINYTQNPGGGNMLVNVNLPVPFKGNYVEIITQVDPDATGYRKNLSVKSQSNNSFVVWSPLGQGTTYYFKWLTIGKWR